MTSLCLVRQQCRRLTAEIRPAAAGRRRFQWHARQFIDTRPSINDEEPQPRAPKTSLTSKLLGFAIGGGLAFTYAWYRRGGASQQAAVTSIDGFTKYTLVDKDDISSTCSIFTIAPLTGKKAIVTAGDHPRSILSIQVKQPQLQIARSYTILPTIPGQSTNTIRLLIRKEEKGEVSGYLHDVALGSDIEIRGPSVDLTFPEDTANVIFLAGGTGIAPAMETAAILQDSANVHILWASRKREDCAGAVSDTVTDSPITRTSNALLASAKSLFGHQEEAAPQEKNTLVMLFDLLKLQGAQSQKKLQVDYYVDAEQSYIRPGSLSKLLAPTDGSGSNLIIVSGPDGFIYHWAGAKSFVDGHQEQGALGGVLSRLNLKGWQVIKL